MKEGKDATTVFPRKSQSQKNTVLHNSLGDPEAYGREIAARGNPRHRADHPPSLSVDPVTKERNEPVTSHDPKRDEPRVDTPDYHDSEIDDWNWDELEASPPIGERVTIQSQIYTHPHVSTNGIVNGSTIGDGRSHVTATQSTMSHIIRKIHSLYSSFFMVTLVV